MKVLQFSLVLIMILYSCQSKKNNIIMTNNDHERYDKASETTSELVPYTIAKNYFVKNTVSTLLNPKIETEEDFLSSFGMASTMGENGKPSVIDFTKEYVIAVVLGETQQSMAITPILLMKLADDTIELHYEIIEGATLTFKTRPILLLVVNNKYQGKVILIRKK